MPCTFLSYKNPASSDSGDLRPLQIGIGTDKLIHYPFSGSHNYSQMGAIYLASELIAQGATSDGGSINNIQFQLAGWNIGYTVNNQKLYLSHITGTNFGGGTVTPDYSAAGKEPLNVTDRILVKSFSYTNSSEEGWELFTFDTPFIWNGTHNILISWENHDGTWSRGSGTSQGISYNSDKDPVSQHRSHVWFEDVIYPTKASADSNGLLNIKINSIDTKKGELMEEVK